MEHQGDERRLAAVLCAEAEGYARPMGADEEAKPGTRNAYRELSSSVMTSQRIQGVLAAVLTFLLSLGIATTARAAPGDILYIQGETASVHQDRSESAPVLIRLNRGHKVMEVERQGSWVRVRMFHTTKNGWVRSPLLAPRFPGETTAAPPQPQPPVLSFVERDFLIEVIGFTGSFKGVCRFRTVDGDNKLVRLKGSVPKAFLIKAAQLNKCTLHETANVRRVEIFVDGQLLVKKLYTGSGRSRYIGGR